MASKESVFKQLGASNHSIDGRESNDFYASEPRTIRELLKKLRELGIKMPKRVIETSVGAGHLAYVLEAYGYTVEGYDIVNRGYGNTIIQDFLTVDHLKTDEPKIFIQNPPYKMALPFVQKSLDLCKEGEYVCALLKIQFLESKERRLFFKTYPPKHVIVFSGRTNCAKNGDFESYPSSAVCYCWYVWQKGFSGKPVIDWCNDDDVIEGVA